jgi:hypothetical protein
MDGTLPKISFLKLQGGGSNNTLVLDKDIYGMDIDHKITQNIHIKIFLLRGHKNFLSSVEFSFLSCTNMGIFR